MSTSPVWPDSLETSRLWLRAPRVEDAAALREAIAESFAELHRWMDWATEIPSVEAERQIMRARAAAHRAGEELTFLIWARDGNGLLGACGLPRIDWDERCFEIGYWIRTTGVGCGYVTEAAVRLARLGFEELGARRMEIRTSTLNRRSAAVAERAGFGLERTLRGDATHPDGSPRDTLIYALEDPAALAGGDGTEEA